MSIHSLSSKTCGIFNIFFSNNGVLLYQRFVNYGKLKLDKIHKEHQIYHSLTLFGLGGGGRGGFDARANFE